MVEIIMTYPSYPSLQFSSCNCTRVSPPGAHWETCPAYDPMFKDGNIGPAFDRPKPPRLKRLLTSKFEVLYVKELPSIKAGPIYCESAKKEFQVENWIEFFGPWKADSKQANIAKSVGDFR